MYWIKFRQYKNGVELNVQSNGLDKKGVCSKWCPKKSVSKGFDILIFFYIIKSYLKWPHVVSCDSNSIPRVVTDTVWN